MTDAGKVRHRCAVLPAGPGQPARPMAAARSLFSYWTLLAPHFRGVLLPPHNRPDESVQWTWIEPAGATAPAAAELAAIRQRLSVSQQAFDEACIANQDTSARAATIEAVRLRMGEIVRGLTALPDSALAGYAARTERGVHLHSWGLAKPRSAHDPGADLEVAGHLYVGGRAASGHDVRLETPDGRPIGQTTSSGDGSFAFAQVKPGRYRVRAVSRPPRVIFSPEGVPVEIAGESVTGLELRDHDEAKPRVALPRSGRGRAVGWTVAGLIVAGLITVLFWRRGTFGAAAGDTAARQAWDANVAPRTVADAREPEDEPVAAKKPRPPASAAPASNPTAASSASRPEPRPSPRAASEPNQARPSPPPPAPPADAAPPGPSSASSEAERGGAPPLAQAPASGTGDTARDGAANEAAGNAPAAVSAAAPAVTAPEDSSRHGTTARSDNSPTADRGTRQTSGDDVAPPPAQDDGPRAADASADPSGPDTESAEAHAGTVTPDRPGATPRTRTETEIVWPQETSLRLSPWRLELLHDAIVPTLPTPIGQEDTVGTAGARMLAEREAGRPARLNPERVITGIHFQQRGPRRGAGWQWQGLDRTAEISVTTDGDEAELTWRGRPPTGHYLLRGPDGTPWVHVEIDATGGLRIRTQEAVTALPWLAWAGDPTEPSRLAWRFVGTGSAPVTWTERSPTSSPYERRLELHLPKGSSTTVVQGLGILDEISGWGLVSEIEQRQLIGP